MSVARTLSDCSPSLAEWLEAAAVLEEAGLAGPAWVITSILEGGDPRDEFGLARVRAEQRDQRNRHLVELHRMHLVELDELGAAKEIASAWRRWADREAQTAQFLERLPDSAGPIRRCLFDIDRRGQKPLSAKMIQRILEQHW